MAQEQVKLGIVGLGNMGSTHIRHVNELPNTQLAAVCDRRDSRLTASGVDQSLPQFSDYETMLDSVDLDGVIIATPHYDHPDMSGAAFERGIHVLVEKPIAVHVQEAGRMIDAWQSARRAKPDLVFAAMFNQRAWTHWRKIKAMIDGGALGQLQRCSWLITDWFRTQSYYDSGDWRASWAGEGGGVLMNQCPHNLDLYQWLVGMPAQVYGIARFGKRHDIEVEDEVTAIFEHDNGMVGHFITTTGESPGSNRLEIAGELGKLVYEDGELVFFRNAWSSTKQLRESPEGFEKVPCQRETVDYGGPSGNGHEIVIANFADAIMSQADVIAPAPEGLQSVMLNNAIILSAHKQQIVQLPIDGGEYADLLRQYIKRPPERYQGASA